MPRAMAINGAFPQAFARESRFGTPLFALIFTSTLVTLVILANYSRSMVQVFTFMVLISTSANVFVYLVCSLAAIRLAYLNKLGPRGPGFRFLVAAALLGSIYSLWAIIGAGQEAVLWGFALMLAGLPIHWWIRRRVPDAFESSTSG
jgi:APA family basic amino acid/polyamine antiporter